MKIRYVVDNFTSVQYYWRVQVPSKYLVLNNLDAQMTRWDDLEGDEDIVVIPKMCVPYDLYKRNQVSKKINESKALFVYDADDNMWSPDFVSYMVRLQHKMENGYPALDALIKELEARVEASAWMMNSCHAVTVSTPYLKGIVERYTNNPVCVVENAIDVFAFTKSLDPNLSLRAKDKIVIGWAGGSRPDDELAPMLKAWDQLCSVPILSHNIEFVFAGWKPKSIGKYTNLLDKIKFAEWTSVKEYGNHMQVDIGCVCIGNNEFSLAKSPIKAWEFALAGAMVIGTYNIPESVLLCSDLEDWLQIIKWYTKNKEEREKVAASQKRVVETMYNIKDNWVYWADAYQKILKTVKRDQFVAL